MKIILNHGSMVPIYEQLCEQIKAAVAAGTLKAGDALPSVRVLAGELKISALTVKKAYDFLEAEGVLVTVHGKGSYVAQSNTALIRETRLHALETELLALLDRARAFGLTAEEIRGLVDVLLEESNHASN